MALSILSTGLMDLIRSVEYMVILFYIFAWVVLHMIILDKLIFLKRKRVCFITILVSMFGLFVIGITFSHITGQYWDVVWNGFDTVFTFINVVSIFLLCSQYKEKENLFRKTVFIISSNTLGIYFIHILFNKLLKPHIQEIAILSNILGNILYTFIILFVSLGTAIVIKKIPILKHLVM